MSSFDKFVADLDGAFEEKVTQNVLNVQKKIALEALRRVILKSPVDTGRFRGNWQVAISVRPDGMVEALDPSGGQTIAKGSKSITSLDDLDVVYLVNNLPYADELENGSSQQAPEGVVAITVAEIKEFFDEAV